MSRRNTERVVKELLAELIRTRHKDKYEIILVDQNPASSPIIMDQWKKKWSGPFPRLQPNIDLLYVHSNQQKITATEVKYFRKEGNRLNYPFYKGIEEALALLLMGFDNVSLLFVFEESISVNQIRQYGGRTWAFIRLICGDEKFIALDFTCVRYLEKKRDFQVLPFNYKDPKLPLQKLSVGDLGPLLNWKHPNPLLRNKNSQTLVTRDLLLEYLKRKGVTLSK